MRSRGSRGERGFTLVELMISLTLLSIIGGIFFMVTDSASSALGSGATVAELNGRARRALDEICEELQTSSSDMTAPQPAAPFFGTFVEFQRGIGADGAGETLWGPLERFEIEAVEADDGVDNDGDGLVDEQRVVWIENPGLANERRVVVCTGVSEYLQGETFDGTDENGNGLIDEAGFHFEFADGRVIVRMSVEALDKQGHRIVSTVERAVSFRNTGM